MTTNTRVVPAPARQADGQVDRYKITVPSGTSGQILLLPVAGDADLFVTRCDGTVVCASYNTVGHPDGCVSPGTYAGFDDIGHIGPALPAGAYTVAVNSCWSSQDGPGCDRAGEIAGLPGALDPLPPVPYALVFETV